MRVAWQQGQKKLFYPYGKTLAEIIAQES